jgi:hypothetical protein
LHFLFDFLDAFHSGQVFRHGATQLLYSLANLFANFKMSFIRFVLAPDFLSFQLFFR